MLIAHISDSHIEIPELDQAGRLADFEKVIADINALAKQPDIVIHTGDVSHCDRDIEYRFSRSFLERLHVPYHVIAGNKDGREGLTRFFGHEGDFFQYVIDDADWQLVMLDTLSDTSNKGAFCQKRRDWLKNILDKATKPVAIFMHHPTYDMPDLPHPFQFESREMANEFEQLVSQYDQVKGIFCGHAHRNTTGFVGQIPAMTLTAMSLDRRKGPYPEEMTGKPVYQLIELAGDGTFKTNLKICS